MIKKNYKKKDLKTFLFKYKYMINSDKKVAKVAKTYYCESCDYKCSNKTNFEKHLSTPKHKKQQNMIKSDEIMINSDKKVAKVENYPKNHLFLFCDAIT